MKRLLAIALVLLMAVTSVSAQRLTVTEVRQAMEPMTVPMQRLDYNNEICALVKVSLPVAGAGFEGNTVGEPLFKINEYWVYLTPGTKMLNVKAPGYHSLMVDFREYGISALESKSIYYVVLDAEGSAPVHQTVTANYGVFTVQPPTAIVKIDGQPQQVVDGSVIALLKLGNHTWQAEAVGYAPASGEFKITAADKTNVSINLVSQMAKLTVSTVADAAVYVNGQQHGSGNQTLELLPGMYNVELRRQGYRPYTQTVELQPSQSATVSCTEFTPVYGMLNVNYRPIGATITLDGRQIGTTPANLSEVNVGTYTLAISAPGYATLTRQVTITETTPVTLTGTLQKQTAASTSSPATTTAPSQVNIQSLTPPDLSQLTVTLKNLDLCAELDGHAVCINKKQWEKLSATKREAYKNKWLYVTGKDESGSKHSFLLALDDSDEEMTITWNEAMSRYGNSLPTKEQGEVMAKNIKAITKAIIDFGGDKDPQWWYWTRTEYDSSSAWLVGMFYGIVNYYGKACAARVRPVAPVPSSAM